MKVKGKIMLLIISIISFCLARKESNIVPYLSTNTYQNPEQNAIFAGQKYSMAIPQFGVISNSRYIPESYRDATKIWFSNGIAFDTWLLGKTGEPELPPELKIEYHDDETGYYIVQFSGPIYGKEKDYLESIGAKIHFYVPNYGFVVSLNSRAQKDLLLSNPEIVWVGNYQPAYKISSLFNRVGDEHKVMILLFLDADIQPVLNNIKEITRRNDFIISDNGINKIIQGVINKKDISSLALIKEIYWIEPHMPPKLHLIDAQWVVQSGVSNIRSIWDKGITGKGEIVNALDTGIDVDRTPFRDGGPPIPSWGYFPDHFKIIAYDSACPGVQFGDAGSYHGSTTTQILCGYDSATGTDYYEGLAFQSKIYFLDGGTTGDTLWIWPDLNEIYIKPYNSYYPPTRAHISSNSWGADVGGTYTLFSLQVDQFMWAHRDFLFLFSNGNSGPGLNTVGAPATAKNCVSVGATGNGTSANTIASFSSRGPTDDGRYKPTVMAPGKDVYIMPGGGGISGTSAACPITAGAGVLAREYLREGWYPTGMKNSTNGWDYVSAAMVKAMLINCSSPNIGSYFVPDNNIGWGRICLDSTLYFEGETRKVLLFDDTIGVLTGEIKDFHFNVPAGSANLKIALVWTDCPGNPAVLKQIVNDLDLYVQIGATYYRGNQYSGGQSVPNASMRDTLNVEECVRVNSPIAGDWLVRVEARNVPYGPQPYALVITYSAPEIAGVVKTDKPVYRANDFIIDTVRVRVEDLNYGTVGVRDTVRVVIMSKYIETQPETLKCIEFAESAYVFKGEMPLLFRGAIHNDGKLSVCQGDTIYVSYTDNNPLFISQVWAGVDAWYFVISNVHCENIDATSVDVCWNTNEGSNSKVYYGTNPSNLNQVVSVDTPYVLHHCVRLTGLEEKTTYYYDVESKDFRGNIVRDNNGNLHYSFTTEIQTGVDILVLLCDGKNDAVPNGQALPELRERFRRATELGGWDYNYWETSDHFGYTPSREIMKNYKAIFSIYEDEYPPFIPVQQETIKRYEELGGRIAFGSHDVLWHAWQNSSTKAYDTTWCKNYMQVRYKYDGTATGTYNIYGVSGDPISGPYSTAPVTYTPHRAGAAYDSFDVIPTPANGWDPGGASNPIWRWTSAIGGRIGVRWESGSNHGTIGNGVWGGHRTRTIFNGFSITQMDTTKLPDVLNNHFIWLIGHDHPDVVINSPIADTTYTTSPIIITWNSTGYGGAEIDTTYIEYSPDGGQTWYSIVADTGLVWQYQWDVSNIQNGNRYRIRVTVNDRNVYPSLKGIAETGNFRIDIPGNDHLGPKVIPNSIIVANNPKFVTPGDTLLPFTAVVSDSVTGISLISAANYYAKHGFQSTGEKPMQVSDGVWDEVQEDVNASIRLFYVPGVVHICSLFVRGKDNAENWGNWYHRTFTLINGQVSYMTVSEWDARIPLTYCLFSARPNPARGQMTITYAIPNVSKINLRIYNCLGQVVRVLVEEEQNPGMYQVVWDACDGLGRRLPAGVYFVRLEAGEFKKVEKAMLLR